MPIHAYNSIYKFSLHLPHVSCDIVCNAVIRTSMENIWQALLKFDLFPIITTINHNLLQTQVIHTS